MRKVGCSNASRDGSNSLKQVVRAPLPNARGKVKILRILKDGCPAIKQKQKNKKQKKQKPCLMAMDGTIGNGGVSI